MILNGIFLQALTGASADTFSVSKGRVLTMGDLEAEAKSSNDTRQVQNILSYKIFVSFWRGEYSKAEEYLEESSKMSITSKLPTIYRIHRTFLGGIIFFQLYRKDGGDERLKNAIIMMELVEKWVQNASVVFENKWLLLKAEHYASIENMTRP